MIEFKKDRYTSPELAGLLHITRVYLSNIKNALEIETEKNKKDGITFDVYTRAQAEKIAEFYDLKEKGDRWQYLNKNAEALQPKPDGAHPLVTDTRCLNPNYWPETEPICFQEAE